MSLDEQQQRLLDFVDGARDFFRETNESASTQEPAHKAECDPHSKYSHLVDGWCYAACPHGFKSVKAASPDCMQECGGDRPADDAGKLCGSTKGALESARTQSMISATQVPVTLRKFFKKSDAVAQSAEQAAKSFSSTIDAFYNAAVAFVYPECDLEDKEKEKKEDQEEEEEDEKEKGDEKGEK